MERITLPVEGDTTTPGKPDFKWLGYMLAITVPLLIVGYGIFYGFAHFVIGNISLKQEKEYFSGFGIDTDKVELFDPSSLSIDIPGITSYNVYVSDVPEINAYATLGANIILTQGLLDSITNEEELVFILGHEMAHIYNRDVLQNALTHIPLLITLSFLGIDISGFDSLSKATLTYMSKNTEITADDGGILLVNELKKNLNCSLIFFTNETDIFNSYIQFTSSHPMHTTRIENIQKKTLYPNEPCTPIKK